MKGKYGVAWITEYSDNKAILTITNMFSRKGEENTNENIQTAEFMKCETFTHWI